MKIRPQKPDDQEETQKAAGLLGKLVDSHPEIEPTLWVGAFMSSIAASFEAAQIPYELFYLEMQRALKFYKHYWEETQT